MDGKHYGISLQFGPNLLLYNTEKEKKPTSWATLYDAKNKGKITIPDNPIQIADAALYLSKTQPSLKITDPYELDQKQFDAAVALLKKQKPLVKKYWVLASDQIDVVKNGGSTLGASWPYQLSALKAAKVPVAGVNPEGRRDRLVGHVDDVGEGEAPELRLHVVELRLLAEGAGAAGDVLRRDARQQEGLQGYGQDRQRARARSTSRNAPESYYRSIKFWKTPLADCGNSHGKVCMDRTRSGCRPGRR